MPTSNTREAPGLASRALAAVPNHGLIVFTNSPITSVIRYYWSTMAKRSYAQYCALARALDVIGDRWTLPVIRDLALGPQRYTDLLTGLSGIGPNLLASRLKELQRLGIVRQAIQPPPSASAVYELTSLGRELRPAIAALAEWGLHFMGPPDPRDRVKSSWCITAIFAAAKLEIIQGIFDTYELVIGAETFHVVIADGSIDIGRGPAHQPDVVLAASLDILMTIACGHMHAADITSSDQVRISGTEPATARCLTLLTAAASPSVSGPPRDRDECTSSPSRRGSSRLGAFTNSRADPKRIRSLPAHGVVFLPAPDLS
jgi:DNA-binding HxlR family transcriptional regulator